MEKILVAIDFSESSHNTFEHAVGLAQRFNANLIIHWVESSKSISHLEIGKNDDPYAVVNQKFDSLVAEFGTKLGADKFELLISKGEAAQQITEEAKKNNVSVIVVGTHGFHGFKKYLMGSNANKVLAMASIPVITIRPNRDVGRDLNVVVVPIDSGLDTRQKLPLATKIARIYGADIHILGLYFTNIASIRRKVDSYTDQAKNYVIKNGVSNVVVHKTATKNGARTILNYAKKVNAGLIAVMIEAELGGSSWSLASQSKQFVNQSPIPILSVANKELIRTAPKL